MKYCTTLLLAVLVSVTTSGTVALGQDWPQWRGPNRDGDAVFRVPTVWPDMLTEQWSVAVGLGYATPLLSANRVYQFVRQGDEEVMMALDADTGDFIWRTTYPAPFTMNPSTSDHGPGPKSTPALACSRLALAVSSRRSRQTPERYFGRSLRSRSNRCITQRCHLSSRTAS